MPKPAKDLLAKTLKGPIELPSNTYLHFYNGGKLRAEFMGEPGPRDDFRSEEWILSTNRAITPGRDNPPDKGFSRIRLADGTVTIITDLLEAFPAETLGEKHVKKYGATLGVLVKIFDVGDGAHIPVHWHPSPEFALEHLKSPYGKNECWIVIGTRPGAKAWVGWKEDVGEAQFRKWMEAQDVEAMRAHLHEITPQVGDIIFLRDGYVHSLGSGMCVLEPQEPSDWNILAEWKGYPYGKEDAHCGLGWDLALSAARFDRMPDEYLNGYVRRKYSTVRQEDGAREEICLPEEARRFFWFTRLQVPSGSRLPMPAGRGFYGAIGVRGRGELRGAFGAAAIQRGKSYFIPESLPGYDVVNTGKEALEVYCCYPPAVS
jgi:mannose-6-phosphate isomerase